MGLKTRRNRTEELYMTPSQVSLRLSGSPRSGCLLGPQRVAQHGHVLRDLVPVLRLEGELNAVHDFLHGHAQGRLPLRPLPLDDLLLRDTNERKGLRKTSISPLQQEDRPTLSWRTCPRHAACTPEPSMEVGESG